MASSRDDQLVRYTSVGAALSLLRERKLTLTSPSLWQDRNDAFCLSEYKRKRRAKSVLALCFSQADETFHHWKVFTNPQDGVRVEFDRDLFMKWLRGNKTLKGRRVLYRQINRFNTHHHTIDDVPFLKRYPYRDEREFRLVYVDHNSSIDAKDFAIDLSLVRRVTLSPWMPDDVVASVKAEIQLVDGCRRKEIYRTTVLDNKNWKKLVSGVEG